MVGDSRPADRLSIEQAYERVAFLRRCVDLRAEAFAGIPFTIRRKTTGVVLYDSEQFKAPNDNLKWCAQIPDLLRLQEIGIVLYGRAYWRPLRRPDGWVNGIQHLYTGSIEEVYGDNGEVVGFKRLITNPKTGVKREVPVPFNEVIAFYNRSPLSEVDGHAPMPVAEAARINSTFCTPLTSGLTRLWIGGCCQQLFCLCQPIRHQQTEPTFKRGGTSISEARIMLVDRRY